MQNACFASTQRSSCLSFASDLHIHLCYGRGIRYKWRFNCCLCAGTMNVDRAESSSGFISLVVTLLLHPIWLSTGLKLIVFKGTVDGKTAKKMEKLSTRLSWFLRRLHFRSTAKPSLLCGFVFKGTVDDKEGKITNSLLPNHDPSFKSHITSRLPSKDFMEADFLEPMSSRPTGTMLWCQMELDASCWRAESRYHRVWLWVGLATCRGSLWERSSTSVDRLKQICLLHRLCADFVSHGYWCSSCEAWGISIGRSSAFVANWGCRDRVPSSLRRRGGTGGRSWEWTDLGWTQWLVGFFLYFEAACRSWSRRWSSTLLGVPGAWPSTSVMRLCFARH